MTPTNINFLNKIGFNVTIDKLPSVSFYTQSIDIPGMAANHPIQPNPFAAIPKPGDMPQFEKLRFTFAVDEDLKNWEELYSYLVGITFPETTEQWKKLIGSKGQVYREGIENNVYSTISVQTLTSAKNPNIEFTYHDCLPVSISGINLDTTSEDTIITTCSAEFVFSHFTISRLKNN